MRIKEFFINGFGIFKSLHIPDVSPGLNIFLGDNEAGKSTLLAYFRAIFFGFETGQSKENQYKPLRGGEHGGIITVEMDREGQQYKIERKPGRMAAGSVTLYGPNGQSEGEESIQRFLPGVTKGLYRNIFAFSLDELQDARSLKVSEVSSRIYSYGAGAGQVSAIDIEHAIEKEMDSIFSAKVKNKPINRLLGELNAVELSIKSLKAQSAEYDGLHMELERLGLEIKEAEDKVEQLRQDSARLERLARAWDDWTQLLFLRGNLSDLPVVESFPENGVVRLDLLIDKRGEIAKRLDEHHIELRDKQIQLDELAIDQRFTEAQVEIEGLMQELSRLESALGDLPRIEAESAAAEDALADSLRQLGEGWTKEHALGFDTSIVVSNEVRQLGERLALADQEMRQAAVRLEDAERVLADRLAEVKAAESELAELQATQNTQPVEHQEEALRTAQTALNCISIFDIQEQSYTDKRSDAERQLTAKNAEMKQANSLTSKWIGIAAGAAVASLAFPRRYDPVFAAIIGVTGAIIALSAVIRHKKESWRIKGIMSDIEDLNAAISAADKEIEGVAKARDKEYSMLMTASEVLGKTIKTEQDLAAVESAVSTARKAEARCSGLEDRLREKKRETETAKTRAEESRRQESAARTAAKQSETAWVSWLNMRNLPETLKPETALDLLSKIEVVRQKSQAVRSSEGRAWEIRDYLADFEAHATGIFSRCGVPTPVRGTISASVRSLYASLEQTKDNVRKKEGLEDSIAAITRGLEASNCELERVTSEIDSLIAAGGASDEESFRSRASWYDERTQLMLKAREYERNLTTISGNDIEEALSQTDQTAIEAELKQSKHELEALQEEIRSQWELRLNARNRVEEIERNGDLSAALLQEESLKEDLANEASEWAVLAISKEMLKRARNRYEREKQPRVVQAASQYLSDITSGAYERVFYPLGQEEVRLEVPAGERKSTNQLSRGTKEQLYLSLRFGLVEEYNRNAEPLPVIMDDILVNFDTKRSQAAAEAILRLADKNQALFFTCHPAVADIFAALGSSTRRFELHNGEILAFGD